MIESHDLVSGSKQFLILVQGKIVLFNDALRALADGKTLYLEQADVKLCQRRCLRTRGLRNFDMNMSELRGGGKRKGSVARDSHHFYRVCEHLLGLAHDQSEVGVTGGCFKKQYWFSVPAQIDSVMYT